MRRSFLCFPLLFPLGVLPASAAVSAHPTGCGPAALGTSRTLSLGSQGGLSVGLKTYPQTLALGDHEVVLTFDDGPNAKTTPAVLDALKQECVRATFFLIGAHAAALPALVRREVAEGQTVAHHTFSHPAATLRGMATDAAEADIERGFKADDMAAYGAYSGQPRVPFFRYPGFADTPEVNRWLAARNVAVFGADLWASDWLRMSPQAELALVMARLERARGGIILLHDSKSSTAKMIPALLRALKAGGFHVVALVPGPGTTAVKPAPKGWSSETDRIIRSIVAHKARRPRADGEPRATAPSPNEKAPG